MGSVPGDCSESRVSASLLLSLEVEFNWLLMDRRTLRNSLSSGP